LMGPRGRWSITHTPRVPVQEIVAAILIKIEQFDEDNVFS